MMVVLKGGPMGFRTRVWEVAGAELPEKVSVPHYGLHVHFEPSGETEMIDGREAQVFRWAYSTAIAE